MNVLAILIFKDIHHGTGSVKTCSSRWIMIQIKTILPKILTPIDAIVLSRRRAADHKPNRRWRGAAGSRDEKRGHHREASVECREEERRTGPVCRTWARCLPPHNHLLSRVPLSPALLPLSRISDERCNAP